MQVLLFFVLAAALEIRRDLRPVLAQRDTDVVGLRDRVGVVAGRICVGAAAISLVTFLPTRFFVGLKAASE